MTKEIFALVKGISTGVEAIAIAVVSYCCTPSLSSAINAAIVIGVDACLKICELFVKNAEVKKTK